MIKELAKVLAADLDVLLRLSPSTDSKVVDCHHDQPKAMNLPRYINEVRFTEDEINSHYTQHSWSDYNPHYKIILTATFISRTFVQM